MSIDFIQDKADILYYFPKNLIVESRTSPYVILTAYEGIILNKSEIQLKENKEINFSICLPPPNEQISILDSHVWEDTKGGSDLLTGKAVEALNNAGGPVSKYLQSRSGAFLNDLSALTYNGPNYRNIELSWTFIPESEGDSLKLSQILYQLRKYSYPDGNAAQAVLSYPLYWDIRIFYKMNEVFRMVDSAIESMTVNYSGGPEGAIATFHNGEPIITNLTITFKQLFKATRGTIQSGY